MVLSHRIVQTDKIPCNEIKGMPYRISLLNNRIYKTFNGTAPKQSQIEPQEEKGLVLKSFVGVAFV